MQPRPIASSSTPALPWDSCGHAAAGGHLDGDTVPDLVAAAPTNPVPLSGAF